MNYDSLIERLLDLAIEEDIATGDISTNAIIPVHSRAVAEMKAKADGVISGLEIARRVYERFEKDIKWEPLVTDGTPVKKGDIILRIEAGYRTLLLGERLSLNILQRMSGIATATANYVKELAGTRTQLLDTRKTAPGLRVLDKMAVHHGGGMNHRMGFPNAVKAARANLPLSIKLEVETTTLEEVQQALDCGADIIMLDNMTNEMMAEAVRLINGRAKTEASGNMNIPRLKSVAATGVDYISVGALTHSVTAMDISMNIVMI